VDSDRLELIGRGKVVDQLLRAGLGVAVPAVQGDIDLVVHTSLASPGSFVVCPLRVKSSATRSFSLDGRYEAVPNLIHVFVWGLATDAASIYALTHREAALVAEDLGYNLGPSWQKDLYAVQPQNRNLVELLEKHRMTPERWVEKLGAIAQGQTRSDYAEV
jgi:hypothetical protein